LEKQIIEKGERTGEAGRRAAGQKSELTGKIFIGGTIHVEGPDMLKRFAEEGEITFEESESAVEFYLHVKNGGQKDSLVEVKPWVNLAEADVEISTDAKDDDPIDDLFTLMFKGPKGRTFCLQVSFDQARRIARLASGYVQAYDLWQTLKQTEVAPGIH